MLSDYDAQYPVAPDANPDGNSKTEPDRETLKARELQRRIIETTATAGYQDLLDIAEALTARAETALIAYAGHDREELAQLHALAKAARTFFHTFQAAVNAACEGAPARPQRRLEANDYNRK
jgi:ABC-type enterochelin transport system substrate-binding protein